MALRKHPAEMQRLLQDAQRTRNWKRWGPYLSERQWGTVREDYSADGSCWSYFPHDMARSRAYRWGEDGLLGWTDRECRLCFSVALWNGNDSILKERLFGLTNSQGNHGEDVKEAYFYLDSTPTHSYCKALYKYPQAAYPYERLISENAGRGLEAREFELEDTGIFDESRYFDVQAEYAKADDDDTLIRLTLSNRGPDAADLHILPTLWFRNTWSWGRTGEGYWPQPRLEQVSPTRLRAAHAALEPFILDILPPPGGSAQNGSPAAGAVPWLFTDNHTNVERCFGAKNPSPWVKDAFDRFVVQGDRSAVNPGLFGTKAAAHFQFHLQPGESRVIELRLRPEKREAAPFSEEFGRTFAERIAEADEFYSARIPKALTEDEGRVMRQAYSSLLWSKQFYHYIVEDWIKGDPAQPPAPRVRRQGRNADWRHLYNRDVISMPDKWEYPWFAAWDLAFHMVPFARLDGDFAKQQLLLFMREWYMHPNGQIPAYEFSFSDVNPPVHAWACWRVYKMTGLRGRRDRLFLARAFQKLLINFTWWVNRKDVSGRHIFAGGFLGLDNIGVFDRSKPLPGGGYLEQADGTAWMAFYCATMLSMALELAREDPAYEDVASKFFEHFVAIIDAINTLGGSGLWDEQDGFFYDQMRVDDVSTPLRCRSLVGMIPLLAVEVLSYEDVLKLPGFSKRLHWFLENRKDFARHVAQSEECAQGKGSMLLAIVSRERLVRLLRRLLDEEEFLSPCGLRSLSRVYKDKPYELTVEGQVHRVEYAPGEGRTHIFGGNSNWRGPIWFPLNFLIIEALERYGHFFGEEFKVECPTRSGKWLTLQQVAAELSTRLCRLFTRPSDDAPRTYAGDSGRARTFAADGWWKDMALFHEYFDGDTGRGCGAAHQTGWTALVTRVLEDCARRREQKNARRPGPGGKQPDPAAVAGKTPGPNAPSQAPAAHQGPDRPTANPRC